MVMPYSPCGKHRERVLPCLLHDVLDAFYHTHARGCWASRFGRVLLHSEFRMYQWSHVLSAVADCSLVSDSTLDSRYVSTTLECNSLMID